MFLIHKLLLCIFITALVAGCVLVIASDNVDVDINAERKIDLNAN